MNHSRSGEGSFARFYLEKVAISEGCGCAEMVIRRDEPKLRRDHSLRGLWQALRQRLRRGRQPGGKTTDGGSSA